jgi:polyhydroxyalkanoate synthesis regulator phasin
MVVTFGPPRLDGRAKNRRVERSRVGLVKSKTHKSSTLMETETSATSTTLQDTWVTTGEVDEEEEKNKVDGMIMTNCQSTKVTSSGEEEEDKVDGGEFHDQGDAKWIVIRRLLRGHNDMPIGRPGSGRPKGIIGAF